ncbi:MAG: FliG C-terminal domain-containing protein [Deltaproteobacteria bacterium]
MAPSIPRLLSGPEKAVLLLLSLDEKAAGPIVSELLPDHVKRLRETASQMRSVPSNALHALYTEFLSKSGESVAVPRGGLGFIRRLSARALGESQTQSIFDDRPMTAFDRVAAAEDDVLAGLLVNEDPQLTAALLSQLPAEKSAAVLALLPEETRPLVLGRLGAMREMPGHLIDEVANAIAAELPEPGAGGAVAVDGVTRSAALVRALSKEVGELLLSDIEAENELLAAEIRQAMYSFEDLKLVDARSMRELLKAVPGDRLTLAIKTASPELSNHIFSGMSKRAAERVREDLELLGAVRLADVEAAQQEIVEVALRLAAEGTLSLGGGTADEFV